MTRTLTCSTLLALCTVPALPELSRGASPDDASRLRAAATKATTALEVISDREGALTSDEIDCLKKLLAAAEGDVANYSGLARQLAGIQTSLAGGTTRADVSRRLRSLRQDLAQEIRKQTAPGENDKADEFKFKVIEKTIGAILEIYNDREGALAKEEIEQLKKVLSRMEGEVAKVPSLERQIEELQTALATRPTRAEVCQRLNSLRNELGKEIKQLDARVGKLERKADNLGGRLTDLEGKIRSRTAKLTLASGREVLNVLLDRIPSAEGVHVLLEDGEPKHYRADQVAIVTVLAGEYRYNKKTKDFDWVRNNADSK